MKTKEAGQGKGWSKQKKQFVALGVLSVVLAGVMVMQFRGGETDFQVAALSQDAVQAAAEPQPDEVEAPAAPVAKDNPVLSQTPAELELTRNPFTSFWSRETSEGTTEPLAPRPSVVHGMTIPGGSRPVAVIDGELRFVGDLVQGWTLQAVHPRSIVLRSPAGEQFVVEMPLFHRELVPEQDAAEAVPG